MNDDRIPLRREEDRAHEEWLIKEQRLTIRAMLLTLAVVIAPFLALPWGFTAALVVLAAALAFTTWLCWSGSNQVGAATRSRLRSAAMLNGAMTVLVLVVVVFRVRS